jgi:hypothetical protein
MLQNLQLLLTCFFWQKFLKLIIFSLTN